MIYQLTEVEKTRLENGLKAALSIFFVDGIEDYIWEAIFSYVKGIPFVDPIAHTRKKQLYDVVDVRRNIGWSAKTIAIQSLLIQPQLVFEIVIQRANIYGKAIHFGYPSLDNKADPNLLGRILLTHWLEKINTDSASQNVLDKRVCILLKTVDNRRYVYLEEDLNVCGVDEVDWRWTDVNKKGLQGFHRMTGKLMYRWYPSGAQLFERFITPSIVENLEIEPKRIPETELIEVLNCVLNRRGS